MTVRLTAIVAAIGAIAALAACGSQPSSRTTKTTRADGAAPPSCAPGRLALRTAGRLTIATGRPAFAPYFQNDDPGNGRGFESAVGYAIGRELGFSRSQISWTTESPDASYAPGRKSFDFDLNEILITPDRARRVDFSQPYFQAPEAVVSSKASTAGPVRRLADLREWIIGVQDGTPSRDAVLRAVRPTKQPRIFKSYDELVTALRQTQVDAVVVDLPTAFSMISVRVPSARIVGQFAAAGTASWGALLEKGSGLTPCVDMALARLRASGRLARLTRRWLGPAAGVRTLR